MNINISSVMSCYYSLFLKDVICIGMATFLFFIFDRIIGSEFTLVAFVFFEDSISWKHFTIFAANKFMTKINSKMFDVNEINLGKQILKFL